MVVAYYRSSPTLAAQGWSSGPRLSVSSAPEPVMTGHATSGGDRSNTTCSYVSGHQPALSTAHSPVRTSCSNGRQFLHAGIRDLECDFLHVTP